MKTRSLAIAMIALVLLIGGVIAVVIGRAPAPAPSSAPSRPAALPITKAAPPIESPAAPAPPPGQARAIAAAAEAPGGKITGRVVNWSTGAGVDGAELTFAGDAGGVVATVRAGQGGGFELTPAVPGRFVLVTASAPGFLPYAPEYLKSPVVASTVRDRTVDGITVFLYPAIDYHGLVIDHATHPIAGAHVRLVGTPKDEQVLDKLVTEWTTDAKGEFTFHAPDGAVLEAVRDKQRGWGRLDGKVAVTHQLIIGVRDAAPRDAQITGRVIDDGGHAVPDVMVHASPTRDLDPSAPRSPAYAISGNGGAFAIGGLDRGPYDLDADAEGFAPVIAQGIVGGSRNVELVLAAGEELAGVVVTPGGAPVPAYTLLASRREGADRRLVATRSIIAPDGRFALHLPRGAYDLFASASGWAPAKRTASAPSHDVKLALSEGATVRGTVKSNVDGAGLPYVRVELEGVYGGASAQPANAGTVSRADGSYELTGLPAGTFALNFGAGGFDPRIEGGLVARDGETITHDVTLSKILEGADAKTELVGIGVGIGPDGDAIAVNFVVKGGPAEAAGIVAGDRILAVEGVPAAELGVGGAIDRIRGAEGTVVTLSLKRGHQDMTMSIVRKKLRA